VGEAQAGHRRLVCSACGRRVSEIREVCEREGQDLARFEYQTTVVLELYRVRCPNCGVKGEQFAEQGALQQTIRRGGGTSLRERCRPAGSPSTGLGVSDSASRWLVPCSPLP